MKIYLLYRLRIVYLCLLIIRYNKLINFKFKNLILDKIY